MCDTLRYIFYDILDIKFIFLLIFYLKYDTPHGLTLGMSYSRALYKLGLDTFWKEQGEFINEHKLDEVDLIKRELEGKYND